MINYALRYKNKKTNIDFPQLKNDEYWKLHRQGKYKEIIENSFRLISKVLSKFQIRASDDLWLDCMNAGAMGMLRVVKKWDIKKGAWSTYSYWYIVKELEQFLRTLGSSSFGCYDAYRKFSKSDVSFQEKICENMTYADIIPSEINSPSEQIVSEEWSSLSARCYQRLKTEMHPKDFKALMILFSDHTKHIAFTQDQIEYLSNSFLKHYCKTHHLRIKSSDMLSNSHTFNRMVSNWKRHLKSKAQKILKGDLANA